MKRFLRRLFHPMNDSESIMTSRRRTHALDEALHEGFKTKPEQGPFLPSFDGRVIPLRKAKFLRRQ